MRLLKKSLNSFFTIVTSISLAAVLSGCATATYSGTKPDISLRGDAAKTEEQKFRLSEDYWINGPDSIHFEKDETSYTTKSMLPLIHDISSEGATRAEVGQHMLWVGMAFVAGGLIGSFMPSTDAVHTASYVITGVGAGIGLWGRAETQAAAIQYNRDLGQKFVPKVSWNFSF